LAAGGGHGPDALEPVDRLPRSPIEGTYKLHACPGEYGGRMQTGEEHCSTCGAWSSPTTGEAV